MPCLLDMPEPSGRTCSRDSAVTEKLEATIALGDRNSRIKDFFGLGHSAKNFWFDRLPLIEAVRRALERRRTVLTDEVSFGLTEACWDDSGRAAPIRAFARRAGSTSTWGQGTRFPPSFARSVFLSLKTRIAVAIRRGHGHRQGPGDDGTRAEAARQRSPRKSAPLGALSSLE